jgi:hypothetical protein
MVGEEDVIYTSNRNSLAESAGAKDALIVKGNFERPPHRISDADLTTWAAAPEHVYFVYSAGRVKIGFSRDWMRRVDRVANGCPHHCETILVVPGGREHERQFHELFADLRVTGEWFLYDGILRRFLDLYASPDGRDALELAHESFLEEGSFPAAGRPQ